MHIGIDLSCLDTPFSTGVERAAVRAAVALSESARVTALTTHVRDGELLRRLERSNVTIVSSRGFLPRAIWRRTLLGRAAKRSRVDLLFCPVAHAPIVEGLSVVRTVHDCPDAHPSAIDELTPSTHAPRRLAVLARRYPTIFVSEATRRDFLRLLPDYDAASAVIGQIVDDRYFAAESNVLRPSFGMGVVVGALRGRRRPRVVDAAIGIVRRTHPGFRLKWIAPAAPRNLELSNIDVSTGVDDDGLFDAYRRTDFVLSPSVLEGFGIVAAEASAQAIPVIAAEDAAVRETTGGHACFYDGESAESLAAAILETTANPEIAAKRAAAARAFVERFRAAAVARRLLDFFATVTAP